MRKKLTGSFEQSRQCWFCSEGEELENSIPEIGLLHFNQVYNICTCPNCTKVLNQGGVPQVHLFSNRDNYSKWSQIIEISNVKGTKNDVTCTFQLSKISSQSLSRILLLTALSALPLTSIASEEMDNIYDINEHMNREKTIVAIKCAAQRTLDQRSTTQIYGFSEPDCS